MPTCQISSPSVNSVICGWQKTPNFAICWTLTLHGVTNWQHTEKVEHGCTTTNLPLSSSIKIILTFQWLNGNIVHTNSVIQKHTVDTQTDKKLNVFGRPGGR